MREIKFRAWDLKTKKMHTAENINFCGRKTVTVQYNPVKKICLDSAILMQYTGAKDKNGVEIYEGDIIRSPAGKDYWIRWSELTYRFVAEPIPANRLEAQLVSRTISNYEVVGNIHESPEFANWEGTKID
nr:MAG TPA: YopX protein [Caudoviricetes sp.]